MLERYIVDALTTQFGHLVRGLDADKVRLSAWKGELVFEDLELRPDVLSSNYNVPLDIVYGHVGQLHIQIPWKMWMKDPFLWTKGNDNKNSNGGVSKDEDSQCLVILTNVNVLVAPLSNQQQHTQQQENDDDDPVVDNSPVAHEQAIQNALNAVLLKRVSTTVTSRKKEWVKKLLQVLLANLTVSIRNIHLRYEDGGQGFCYTQPQQYHPQRLPFAVGLTLKEFHVSSQTPNNNEQSGADKTAAATTYTIQSKRVAAQELAAYWDSETSLLFISRSPALYPRLFGFLNDLTTTRQQRQHHSYVLDSFSPLMQIHFVETSSNTSESNSAKQSVPAAALTGSEEDNVSSVRLPPPSSVELTLPPCRLAVSRDLLEDLGYLRTSLLLWKHTKLLSDGELKRLMQLRPSESAKVNPKGWWMYAVQAVLALEGVESERPGHDRIKGGGGWLGVTRAIRNRNRYVALYRKVLLSSNVEEQNEAHASLMELERTLSPDEGAAFRLAVYRDIQSTQPASSTATSVKSQSRWAWRNKTSSISYTSSELDNDAYDGEQTSDEYVLSLSNRVRLFGEMTQVLDQEAVEIAEDGANSSVEEEKDVLTRPLGIDSRENRASWVSRLSCPEISLQVNDRPRKGAMGLIPNPVVVVSFAFLQEQTLYQDSSWETTSRLGSLQVKDCTQDSGDGVVLFPNIISCVRKFDEAGAERTETFLLDDVRHHQSVQIKVQRSFHSSTQDPLQTSSTTKTEVKVLPLEVVYSTAPVEALSRFVELANVEFKEDYRGIVARLSAWRNRQQRRLFQALAHRQKSIVIDLDVGAPVLLVPEERSPESPLLVIDLGRLHFRNAGCSKAIDFDDKWRLDLTDIQVQCTTSRQYRGTLSNDMPVSSVTKVQSLIEPFCLEFEILTRIHDVDGRTSEGDTSIQIVATLPRLVFNITTSAVRLLKRLQNQWAERKTELQQLQRQIPSQPRSVPLAQVHQLQRSASLRSDDEALPSSASRRRIMFLFNAPLLKIQLENDVDGSPASFGVSLTANGVRVPLVNLSLRGIEGKVIWARGVTEDRTLSWSARLRALDAVDLFQTAGKEFSLLLSSVSPDLLPTDGGLDTYAFQGQSKDLVLFDYETDVPRRSSLAIPTSNREEERENRLNVHFHELYVEWNPETLAAIQVALSLPQLLSNTITPNARSEASKDSDFAFFDAEEDEFFDTREDESFDSDGQRDNRPLLFQNVPLALLELGDLVPRYVMPERSMHPVIALQMYHMHTTDESGKLVDDRSLRKPNQVVQLSFSVYVEVSKLRFHFNKEARHRRLFIAEMDKTSMEYTTKNPGRWTSHVSMGNLTFADADSMFDLTLYREILGLKTDCGQSSLLTLVIEKHPRSRRYVKGDDALRAEVSLESGVTIDVERKEVLGCDYFLQARFSPMRFVYLQQLWFEIIDYFFEGIIGAEVWGSQKLLQQTDVDYDAPNADLFSFTRFDVKLETPVIIFPVSYCSTDYLRLEATSIDFDNRYTCSRMRVFNALNDQRLQWFNNCSISMDGLQFSSSAGSRMTQPGNVVGAKVLLNWPSGPTAQLNCPKWNVDCVLDTMHLSLEREDYALLQHVVQHNICANSRHLDEWQALQELPPHVLQSYKQHIKVHFGYDKKDVTPTTYEMKVTVPEIKFSLQSASSEGVADVRCDDITWHYKKMSDLVSRQQISCNVDICGIGSNGASALLTKDVRDDSRDQLRENKDLVYTTMAFPSGDTSKSLVVTGCRIRLVYSVWARLLSFFKGLSGPKYVEPEKMIQFGDRWYALANNNNDDKRIHREARRLTWLISNEAFAATLSPNENNSVRVNAYILRLLLVRPSIIVGSEERGLVLQVDEIEFNSQSKQPRVKRNISVSGMQLQTRSDDRATMTVPGSLIEPWSGYATVEQCGDIECCSCSSHSIKIDAEVLKAMASFVDMTVAIHVLLEFIRDMRETQNVMSSLPSLDQSNVDGQISAVTIVSGPPSRTASIHWKGLQLVVIDDSCRHFAGSQELAVFTVKRIELQREETMEHNHGLTFANYLRLGSVDMVDSLQSVKSPFRQILALRSCDRELLSPGGGGGVDSKESHAAIEIDTHLSTHRTYSIKVNTCALQYNPSLVIALQRFVGRLLKDATQRIGGIKTKELELSRMPSSSADLYEGEEVSEKNMVTVNGTFEVTTVIIHLNKEHQGRQLLKTTISDCLVDLHRSDQGMCLRGHLGALHAFDDENMGGSGRTLLRAGGKSHFLQFCFRTFALRSVSLESKGSEDVPHWVMVQLLNQGNCEIDDCLELAISALEVTYLKGITKELADYLNNGMPGRGMGATGRAAKGFVEGRIQTKSFLQVSAEAPTIVIPVDTSAVCGISCRLGEITVKSWIEGTKTDASRKMAVKLSGLSAAAYRSDSCSDESPLVSEIDIVVDVEKSKRDVAVRTTLSRIHVPLKYSDFVLLKRVYKHNIGREVDRTKWDNLEAAWEQEFEDGEQVEYSKEVLYSASARIVRYGTELETNRRNSATMDLQIHCDQLTVVLHRDEAVSTGRHGYDFALLSVLGLGASANIDQTSESFSISLRRLNLFDLCGRRYQPHDTDGTWKHARCSVLVEGYTEQSQKDMFDSQFVMNIHRGESTSGDTAVSVVVNYLSVALLRRPIEDVVSFLSRGWSLHPDTEHAQSDAEILPNHPNHSTKQTTRMKETQRGMALKLSLHYPRFIFVADETEQHSRAIVLEGLAMANVNVSPNEDAQDDNKCKGRIVEIQGEFQKLSSYIQPDVYDMLSAKEEHFDILTVTGDFVKCAEASKPDPSSLDSQRIALLLPLTLAVEYKEKVSEKSPQCRSLAVSVDSLQMVLSREDVSLVRELLQHRPKEIDQKNKTLAKETSKEPFVFDVTFETDKLGLGLLKDGNQIVVDHVDLSRRHAIGRGDVLLAISGLDMTDAASITLSTVVEHLRDRPRPLTVTFARYLSRNDEVQFESPSNVVQESDQKGFSFDSLDFSLLSGAVTLVEHNVTLLRVKLAKVQLGLQQKLTNETLFNVKFVSGFALDYYNLRAWVWEPMLEPGSLGVSAEYQVLLDLPNELSIEIRGREEPFCLNCTDAGFETVGKLALWGESPDADMDPHDHLRDEDLYRKVVSHKAANAALQFALRQKDESAKPFIFRNRCGLEVSFALQNSISPIVGDTSLSERVQSALNDSTSTFDVKCGEDCQFFVQVERRDDSQESGRRFPLLVVWTQSIFDVSLDPIRDLDINQAGETMLPLCQSSDRRPTLSCEHDSIQQWASWNVEYTDEKTILTFGGSIQLLSALREMLDIGVEFLKEGSTNPVFVSVGECNVQLPLYLPVWLGFLHCEWRCVGKFKTESQYAVLFTSSDFVRGIRENFIKLDFNWKGRYVGRFLSITIDEVSGVNLISIDCAICFRNLLPTRIDWTVSGGLPPRADVIDSSDLNGSAPSSGQPLSSGGCVEVFSEGVDGVYVQLRLHGEHTWSSWVSLSLPEASENKRVTSFSTRDVQIVDDFGIPSLVGLRITRKGRCVEVFAYAEFWIANYSRLPVVFGSQSAVNDSNVDEKGRISTELSTAEVALKEFSSLFDGGVAGSGFSVRDASKDDGKFKVERLSQQAVTRITEECFEYEEIEDSRIKRHWWADESPFAHRENPTALVSGGNGWDWIDKSWNVDELLGLSEGWEVRATLQNFTNNESDDSTSPHRFRRRRWFRERTGTKDGPLLDGVTAFYQPDQRISLSLPVNGKTEDSVRIAVQVEGGQWTLTSLIPRHGSAHGAIRVPKSRWPKRQQQSNADRSIDRAIYELCYSVAPLDDAWGDLTRLVTFYDRFRLRNDSKIFVFEAKQAGAPDSSAVRVHPGETSPFHWADFRLPGLICLRPVESSTAYKWSGGFDPLTIGALPLRVRKSTVSPNDRHSIDVNSIKAEIEVRPKSGGTGINITFQEEDGAGTGALFRIENLSSMPIWLSQDGLLANNNLTENLSALEGDVIRPHESAVFALDVPFRQGKYAGRMAATILELMRARVALAPLNSRYGIETTKVVSMISIGERVRLNPSKLMVLSSVMRKAIRPIRVVGSVMNDGPTRVLRFSLAEKTDFDFSFSFPFEDDARASNTNSTYGSADPSLHEIQDGAHQAQELLLNKKLKSEDEVVARMADNSSQHLMVPNLQHVQPNEANETESDRDVVISFRAEFRGFVLSLTDSAPSEICVVSLNNVNAMATWNMQRTDSSTAYVTVASLQVDNMIPNAPFPVAVLPTDQILDTDGAATDAPLLVIGISAAPRHQTGVVCFKSITIAPRNLSIHIDLAFLVRLQKFLVDILFHFRRPSLAEDWGEWTPPDIAEKAKEHAATASFAVGHQKFYFEGVTILPCNIKLSVAPARALTRAQALLEGEEAAQIHQAVRKGDVRLGDSTGLLGVKVGHRNKTPLAVVRGVFKSIVVDALLRLDGASLEFAGVSLRNHTTTSSQLMTHLAAHYMASLRQNVPALLGSLAAFGNPLGLVRGFGDGVSDFVLEPVKGFQKSVQEMDATYLVDGVARGTLSLARHTVGGIADSAAMLTETFSKNMTALTLDRRYAQRRDRKEILREQGRLNPGLGSGVSKLAQGFIEGVTGVVEAPLRGAEKRGFEGFAKGIGKGLLGLLVKPIIGISDGITDVMMGVRGTVDGSGGSYSSKLVQVRPRRALYGSDRVLRVYNVADAAASALMMRTRVAGERYLGHLDMGDRVALFTVKRMLLLGSDGKDLLTLKYKHIESLEVRQVEKRDGSLGWAIIVVLNTPRSNGSELEVISCRDQQQGNELLVAIERGRKLVVDILPSGPPQLEYR